ncbi:uncharacterized protein LOC130766160 [Actinidia eriantha]|uniref:uncharacterized protein LOC130766160 n=1 Tax=Actinidia eriantha TaxID=165200 RepID=UPI002587BDF5|nr:uncharacterized protein LOC130766160 [Actinidia eriantha]
MSLGPGIQAQVVGSSSIAAAVEILKTHDQAHRLHDTSLMWHRLRAPSSTSNRDTSRFEGGKSNGLGEVFGGSGRDFISLDEEREDGGMKGLVGRIMEVYGAPNLSDFYPIFGGLDLQGLKKKAFELMGRAFAM